MIAVALISISSFAVAAYIFSSVNVPFKVKEPLTVTDYPSLLSLFPNQTLDFNVTVRNIATVDYVVVLNFTLNDTSYQQTYVTFSSDVYTVGPGDNVLEAWMKVVADAPATNLSLGIDFNRVLAAPEVFGYTFTWSKDRQCIVDGDLVLRVNFTWNATHMIILVNINFNYGILFLFFDRNFNRFGAYDDRGYGFWPDNTYYNNSCSLDTGGVGMPQMLPQPSPYHTCTFNNKTGLTYRIALPKDLLPHKYPCHDKVLRAYIVFEAVNLYCQLDLLSAEITYQKCWGSEQEW